MSTLSPKSAVQIVKSKANNLITSTGKFELVVSTANTSYVNERGQHIINLKAMTTEMKAEAKDLLRAGDFQKAANVGLSYNVYTDGFVPSKGETVFAQVGYVPSRAGGEVLRITALSPMPVSQTATTSASEFEEFDNMLEDDSVEASVEAVADVTVD
jgi:hypothetical protein